MRVRKSLKSMPKLWMQLEKEAGSAVRVMDRKHVGTPLTHPTRRA